MAGSNIPGFNTDTLKVISQAALPGFTGPQLNTYYNKDKKCDGSSDTKLGSVLVEANQVGFGCDFPPAVDLKDFKPIKCNDPGCFNKKQCNPTHKQQYFGLVDKDGKTCKGGTSGCTFEKGINPINRIVKTRYVDKSSFRLNIGVECKKPAGQTCTRNIKLRADYQNAKPGKRCNAPVAKPCTKFVRNEFDLSKTTLAYNNLGGVGPGTHAGKELRFKSAGQTRYGRKFDVVARVAPGSVYMPSATAKVRNGVTDKLGNINVEVKVDAKNKGLELTDFIFSLEDSLTGDVVKLEEWDVTFFDFDVNKAKNLHERICVNMDQFVADSSKFPGKTSDVTVLRSDTKDCHGKASKTGSVLLESNGVGFLCDNPKNSQDLGDVGCTSCFTKGQCLKVKNNQFFPIKRSGRVFTSHFEQTGSFTVSFGIKCKKAIGETCNRNFMFTSSYQSCASA